VNTQDSPIADLVRAQRAARLLAQQAQEAAWKKALAEARARLADMLPDAAWRELRIHPLLSRCTERSARSALPELLRSRRSAFASEGVAFAAEVVFPCAERSAKATLHLTLAESATALTVALRPVLRDAERDAIHDLNVQAIAEALTRLLGVYDAMTAQGEAEAEEGEEEA
jgi:hypothetical protein